MINLFKSVFSLLRLLLNNQLQIRYKYISRDTYNKELSLLVKNEVYVNSILEISLPNVQVVLNEEFAINNYRLSISNCSDIPKLLEQRLEELQDKDRLQQHSSCNTTDNKTSLN
jgi:hypothetical protein